MSQFLVDFTVSPNGPRSKFVTVTGILREDKMTHGTLISERTRHTVKNDPKAIAEAKENILAAFRPMVEEMKELEKLAAGASQYNERVVL